MRFKCRTCKNSFTPNYVEFNASATAPPSAESPVENLATSESDSTTTVPPPITPSDDRAAAPAKPKSFTPFTTAGFSQAAPARPPEPKSLELPKPPQSNGESLEQTATESTEPSPAGAESKAKHKRVRTSEKTPGQLRPFELILAGVLMLAVIGGVATVIYYLYGQPKDPMLADAGETQSDRMPTAADNEFSIPKVAAPTSKPRPARLLGAWELRSDDGRVGRLVFRQDGSMSASSSVFDSPMADYSGGWFVHEADGDRYVLEFGKEQGGTSGFRVTVIVNNVDAFTLLETVRNGLPATDQQRFVRLRPAK